VNGASDSDATTSDSELPELIDVEPENVDGRMAQVLVISSSTYAGDT
jgi:hypothetical protein